MVFAAWFAAYFRVGLKPDSTAQTPERLFREPLLVTALICVSVHIVEQHATWDIGWARGAGGAAPRMQWLRVVEFEQAESRQPTGALFVDCT